MTKQTSKQSGFSAVELLITLFIAVAFIATGYQLYSFAISNGGDTSARVKASSLGYEELRAYQNTAQTNCADKPDVEPSDTKLTNPVISFDATSITTATPEYPVCRIQVTVTYGPASDREVVRHALYVSTQ